MDVLGWLRAHRVRAGDLVGLTVEADSSVTLAVSGGELAATAEQVLLADSEIRPRWAMWSQETAQRLIGDGVRLTTSWDVATVQRLVSGRWRADPEYVWARLHGVPDDQIPGVAAGEPDLFSVADDDQPTQPLGAAEALTAAELQQAALAGSGGAIAVTTARAESTVELLCAELAADGLPVDRAAAEELLAETIGARTRSAAEAAATRAARDGVVLGHAPAGVTADLRSPGQVRALLAAAGIDVPDTRAHRLEEFRDRSPLVAALLDWRKAERIATTYGYAWLDEHLGDDGRLRGEWTGSDGAAGRMTASAGLHNMPTTLRPAVVAADGHVFVRADLGQIEPRVLAAVSGDQVLVAAARADDLYAPVAAQLGVDRPVAKVAVLGAMYGQTTGHGAQALRRLNAAYPVAMAYLEAADRAGRAGRDLRTYGGRRIVLAPAPGQDARSSGRVAAYGRYARNAMIQGAAAELFKMWAVIVRARCGPLDARIVLCLHDELLVHSPREQAETVSRLVDECLREAAQRWAPGCGVRFISDTSIVRSWSDAKNAALDPAGP